MTTQQRSDPSALPGWKRVTTTPISRAEMIESTAWGNAFTGAEVLSLAEHMKAYRLAPNHYVFQEGETTRFACLIISGEVDIEKADTDGEKKILATARKGHTLGEMSLIDGTARSASALALRELNLLSLSVAAMEQIIENHPRLAVKLLQRIAILMSNRLRLTTTDLVDTEEC